MNIYCLLLALSCSLEEFLWILDTVANVVGPCACLHSLHRQLAPLELRADCRRYVPSYFVAPLCISIGPLLLCAAVFVALIVVLAAGGDSSCGHLRCKWLQALLWWQRAIDYLNAGTAQKQLQRLAAVGTSNTSSRDPLAPDLSLKPCLGLPPHPVRDRLQVLFTMADASGVYHATDAGSNSKDSCNSALPV